MAVRSFDELMGTIPADPGPRDFADLVTPVSGTVRSFDDLVPHASEEEIGFGEAVTQDIEEKVPFSPMGIIKPLALIDSAKRLQADAYEDVQPELSEYQQYPSPDEPGYDAKEAHRLFTKEASIGALRSGSEQRAIDIERLGDYFEEQEERSRRGYSFMGKVGAIGSEIPALAIEFLVTGGMKKLGTEAARRGATAMLRRQATTSLGKAAIATAGAAGGVTLRAAGLPHRAASAIAKRQVPRGMKIDDDGTVHIEGPLEGPSTSIVKGLADHWITIASEHSGEAFGPAFRKSFGFIGRKMPIIGPLIGRLQSRWLSKGTGRTIKEFNKKISTYTGFNGTVTEMGEEWIDNNLKALLDIESFGAGPDADWQDRVVMANKNFVDNLPAMAVAFLPMGAAQGIGNIAIQKEMKKQEEYRAELDMLTALERNAPTEIETAEGTIGFDSGFFAENYMKMEEELPAEMREPGIGKYFTPKWLVNRMIGAETLLEDVTAAHMAMNLERNELQGWIGSLVKKLRKEKELTRLPELLDEESRKEAQVSLADVFQGEAELERPEGFIPKDAVKRTRAHILQKKLTSDNPVHIMRDLLDTYDDAPSFLNESETNLFNQVRELTRYMLDRVNRAREKRGDTPIDSVDGYITHWLDAQAAEIVQNRQRMPKTGILGSIATKLGKQVKNATAERRKVHGELEEMFSKDLGRSLQMMVKHDLRDIYVTSPYQNALAELNELDAEGLVPKNTYRAIEDYLRYDIREYEHPVDKMFNVTMKKPSDLIKRLTFGKVVIDDPARQVFGTVRKLGFLSALGFRVKAPLRNLGQRMLLQDLYRTRDYVKAQNVAFRISEMPDVTHPTTGEQVPLIDLIREQDWYKTTLQKFEDVVSDAESVVTRFGEATDWVQSKAFHVYSRSHAGNLFLSNVEVAALTGYFDWQNSLEQSKPGTKHYKEVIRYAVKNQINPQQLLTQEGDMNWAMREAVRRTQWEYFATSMPTIYRGQVARAAAQFQSWMMNYYTNHVREMASELLTGRNSKGRLIPGKGRLRSLKGMGTISALGHTIEGLFNIAILKFLLFPDISRPLSAPIPNFILSLAAYWGAEDDKQRKSALKQLKRALKFWLPYSLALKDMWELLSGEQDFSDLIFYKKKKKE